MENIIESFKEMVLDKAFPCVAAKDALKKGNVQILTATHLACPHDDQRILDFIYDFIKKFRKQDKGFHSVVILFPHTQPLSEVEFEAYLFQRLKALRALDAKHFAYDPRVSDNPQAKNFSFSLMEEAFFIIGLHPGSSRPARQSPVPAIVFNPHVQFERLRDEERYEKMKAIVRKKDVEYSGSTNPMLMDFGDRSEVYQYSGRQYASGERCPFNL
ncbi:hypothetical protein BCY91_16910 [Pelobium manganitolerans]|uniref:YqcI/YcgG family protein n=2 Tax=Pelobium manganitolerans TaxID=1842495 RepID=A0A419S7U0_9SPHI|nr:hypothetical protein BCY91_16910 [Pelobium manganitolerans]